MAERKLKAERLYLTRLEFYDFALKLANFALTTREIKVLLFRYYCKLTLKEVGKVLNGKITKQRVFQIEKKALERIKASLSSPLF